jgi:glycine/sarcosine N-methyltransferase
MSEVDTTFYDGLAAAYHLLFQDWDAAIQRQRTVLRQLLPAPANSGKVLDCACGIGTQALGLAQDGYVVDGTDLSPAAIERAVRESAARKLLITFRTDDMRELRTCPVGDYGVVLALDNALPHLDSEAEITLALTAMRDRLRSGGKLLISLRDYEEIMADRPSITSPALYRDRTGRRIVHQVWDWKDARRYTVHLFITRELADGNWNTMHFEGHYRAVSSREVADRVEKIGFQDVQILNPETTGYYQPIVSAVRI